MSVTIAASDRYPVTVEQYRAFRRDGFVVVRGLVSAGEVGSCAGTRRS
jgi:hypothetical protein